ncbi:hypothetical protein P691DRAFT_830074 [Macrolepiota fuliginosa MF-IS2]|uniref:F-box domain-containing protein n=1 Tax=Macrolepiota fuliginosa MF-IS2 TaxID=1400762 RepID=A0A9P5XA28_9AGAR|nr:hypothetical protein P691DRAFT_830074 [Macrolepiota fuliginosa MF-IS2]
MTAFLSLPDDTLVEIFCHLPVLTILLCRQTCQRLNRLSRERHLWIRIFNQTQHMLRPTTDVGQKGAFEVERTIAQAEVLERLWTNAEELWIAPRYWRGASQFPKPGQPKVIMGEYVVFLCHNPRMYIWIFIHDIDKTIAFEFAVPSIFTSYLDPMEKTFFVIFPLEESSL